MWDLVPWAGIKPGSSALGAQSLSLWTTWDVPVYVFWGGPWGCVCTQSLQLCLTLCDRMNCRLPDSSVDGIFQARILEWIAMPSSRGYSWPRDWTHLSWVCCITSGFFTAESLGKPIKGRTHQSMWSYKLNVTLFEVVGESSGEVIEATGNLQLALLRERSALEGWQCIFGYSCLENPMDGVVAW